MRARWSGVKAGDSRTLKVAVTRVATLLTFCPPGPPLREAEKESSSGKTCGALREPMTLE